MQQNTNPEDIYKTMDYSAQYSENLPTILKHLNISLAFTSYQASRLMLVRSDGEGLDINFKTFPRPMGLTATCDSLTLGTYTQVIQFQREDGLLAKIKQPLGRIEDDVTAPRLEKKSTPVDAGEPDDLDDSELPGEELEKIKQQRKEYQDALYAPVDNRVDSCFITRSAHYSGMINIHDIDWGNEGLWAVNSSFSCLCTLDSSASFVPRWKPHFISDLGPEDRCHLNGMGLKDGYPAFVTTFSKSNTRTQWRKADKFDGTLMSVEQNEILIDGLSMPHSPRWYEDKVYFCNSALGQLCTYDPSSGRHEVLAELQGFTRGIAFYGSLLFVGLSKVRVGNVTRSPPLADKYDETFSGIWVFDLVDKRPIGYIRFSGNVDQIYDVAVLQQTRFPELIEPGHPRLRNHFCFKDRVQEI